jgi:hypothetical protein
MRPFDIRPDLLADSQAVDAFMSRGMPVYAELQDHFGLSHDVEGGLRLAIALQAYAQGDVPLAARALREFAAAPTHLECLGRVFEVLYKCITPRAMAATPEWLELAVALHGAYPGNVEARRLAIEFFAYFGLWNHALVLLDEPPREPFQAWREHVMLRRALAEGFVPRRRFSFLVLTWNRADLLDACLSEIRAKAGSDDHEIIVGVNACTDHTEAVLARHGVDRVLRNARNDSIDYYRALFDAGQGEILIEIDDNVVELPRHFDLELAAHLAAFPEIGYIGYQPTALDRASGQRVSMDCVAPEKYRAVERDGLTLHLGPVWGCCAAIAKRDYLAIGGFYGLRLSKTLGEEPQLTRKLRMRDKGAALLRGATLLKAY